jgi:hypothetical protein
MALQSSFRDIDTARATLLKWAVHIAHNEATQRALVDKTIEAATINPFELAENEPVDRALMSLMLRIAQAEMAGKPAHH